MVLGLQRTHSAGLLLGSSGRAVHAAHPLCDRRLRWSCWTALSAQTANRRFARPAAMSIETRVELSM